MNLAAMKAELRAAMPDILEGMDPIIINGIGWYKCRIAFAPERQTKRRVAVAMGGGHAQVIRHAPQIAPEPGEGEGDNFHTSTVAESEA